MADTKITALTALTAADPANDVLPIVDVSDTTMAASGTTKKISVNNILGCSGTATLASASITGDLTVDTSTLKVDSANNRVGVGTASPAVALDVVGSAQFSGNLTMTTGSLNSQYWYGINATSMLSSGSGSWPLLFGINGSEKARIDASGNLLVGTTSSLPSFANGRIEVLSEASSYCMVADATATSAAGIGVRGNDSTVAASFYNASTGGTVGSIVINSGGVSYNTTSDYRLKESIKPISGGLARVNALKPSIYNWKSNGSSGEGFLAHELAEVVPFAVTGEKDAVNEDGSIKAQSIDMSRVVPILVAAIQELTAEVNALKNA